MAWLIPPFLRNFIVHLQYLVPIPFNLTEHVKSLQRVWFLYLGKHLFCQIFRANHHWEWQSIWSIYTHVFYRTFPVDFLCVSSRVQRFQNKAIGNSQFSKCRNACDRPAIGDLRTPWNSWRSRQQGRELIFMARGFQLKGHWEELCARIVSCRCWMCHASSGHAGRCHSGRICTKGHFLQGSPPESAHWCSQLRLVLLISSVQVTCSFAGRRHISARKPP